MSFTTGNNFDSPFRSYDTTGHFGVYRSKKFALWCFGLHWIDQFTWKQTIKLLAYRRTSVHLFKTYFELTSSVVWKRKGCFACILQITTRVDQSSPNLYWGWTCWHFQRWNGRPWRNPSVLRNGHLAVVARQFASPLDGQQIPSSRVNPKCWRVCGFQPNLPIDLKFPAIIYILPPNWEPLLQQFQWEFSFSEIINRMRTISLT